MASPGKYSFKDKDMQAIIGWILRVGIITSMAIVVVGGILYIYHNGYSITDYRAFKKVPDFISDPAGVFDGLLAFNGQAIIQLGIILLIATPVLRVAFAAIGFLVEKDYLYTLISVIVLLIIVGSMITGHGG
jgi:uncharacterized membrane protein